MIKLYIRLLLSALVITMLATRIKAAELRELFTFDVPTTRGLNVLDAFDRHGLYVDGPYVGTVPITYPAGPSGRSDDAAMGLDEGSFPWSEYLTTSVVPVDPGTQRVGVFAQQFSISMWIKPQEKTAVDNWQGLLSNTFPIGEFQPGFRLTLNTPNTNASAPDDRSISFYSNIVGGATPVNVTSEPGVFQHDTWQLLCLLVDRTANKVQVFIDGAKVLDGPTAPGFNIDLIPENPSNDYLWVGSMFGNKCFKGAIDNIGVYDGLLSSAEMEALRSFEIPAPTLLSRYTFDDSAMRGKNSVAAADQGLTLDNVSFSDPGPSGFSGDVAARFGLGQQYGSYSRYMAAIIPLRFTITLWINPQEKTTVDDYQCLLSNTFVGEWQPGFRVSINSFNEYAGDPDDRTVNFYSGGGSVTTTNGFNVKSAPGAIQHNTWQMLSFVVDRVANTVKGYVNGTKVLEGDTYPGFSVDPNYVGYNNAVIFFGSVGNNNIFEGAMDDVRLYNGLLSVGEIQYLVDTVDGPIVNGAKNWSFYH